MKTLREISTAIRRRETPFYAFLYRLAKGISSLSMPTIRPVHAFLYRERLTRLSLWHNFWRIVYYEPLFKSQCVRVGRGFTMHYAGNGTATVFGDLQIYLGDNVTMFDNTGLAGLKVFDKPELHVGDNTYLGPLVRIMVGKKITIGSHCLITSRIVTDNPGHSMRDTMRRITASGGLPAEEDIRPVHIGDFCFLPLDTVVYPGVRVGDGVVARIGTHISRDVPPFCHVAGNPMRIVRKVDIPEQIREMVGDERYEAYLQAHANLDEEL